MYKSALHYLTCVVGLCQTPYDMWTDEDRKILREAGEFIQKQQEINLESKREEESQKALGASGAKPRNQDSAQEI